MFVNAMRHADQILVWGLAATMVLTIILYGSQGLGLSRLSLPYLFGTFVTANRQRAGFIGFLLYLLGGWAFALFYYLLLDSTIGFHWWAGAAVGLVHGLFLLVVLLPVLPLIHPRMATEYDGPTSTRRLEPPGFMGLNYGSRTPLTTLFGHTLYGLILGVGLTA